MLKALQLKVTDLGFYQSSSAKLALKKKTHTHKKAFFELERFMLVKRKNFLKLM